MNINTVDLNRPQRFSQFNTLKSNSLKNVPQFEGHKKEAPASIKLGAVLSSVAGMSAALALIAKKQGFPLNLKTIKNTPVKDWAIFKIAKRKEPNRKLLEIEEKEIITLASGSIAGGLLGGAIFDRQNMKAKGREALTQMAGNILIPVGFVGGAGRIYKNYEKQLKSYMPQLVTKGSKTLRITNKLIKSIPAIAITTASLAAGIYTGSKITNMINEKLFGQKKERKIKSSDFAPHVDDLSLAITLMGSKNSPVTSTITRTIPLFLSVPGYQVGKAQEEV